MKFILGKKLMMSQVFDEKGKVFPVTLVEAGPCYVLQVKTKEKDGYQAVQIGLDKKKKNIKKTEKGKEYRYVKEFPIPINQDNSQFSMKIGDEINLSIFQEGEKIKVSGISKGKGFQGAVKRWGFHGRNATHGVKHEQRTLGSVGSAMPERVVRGKKMPGRMGSERVTVKNLEIIKVDKENNILAVKGALPGKKGTLLEIKS